MSFPTGHALYCDTRLNNLSWPQSHVRNSREDTGLVLEAWNQFTASHVSAVLLATSSILLLHLLPKRRPARLQVLSRGFGARGRGVPDGRVFIPRVVIPPAVDQREDRSRCFQPQPLLSEPRIT